MSPCLAAQKTPEGPASGLGLASQGQRGQVAPPWSSTGLHFPQEEEGQVHNQGRSRGFLCSLSLGRGSQRAPSLGRRLTQAAPHLRGPGTGAGCFPSPSILGIPRAWVPAMPRQAPVSLSLAFRPLMGSDSGRVSVHVVQHMAGSLASLPTQ